MDFDKLINMIRNIGITEEVTYSTRLQNDLCMDSTELVDLSTAILKEFGVSIQGKELKGYSIEQVLKIIEDRKSE